jgi:glycosyltransferase involved in cell wall biosynthesis
MADAPLVTVAVPSLGHGRYIGRTLESIFAQEVPVEVYVADAGSTDGTLEVIRRWETRLLGWRSHRDAGQAAAINEGVARGSAPYVCWVNSDDWLLEGGLRRLCDELAAHPEAAMAYGRAWNCVEGRERMKPVFVRPFSAWLMARLNIISQPATLVRRSAWEEAGGVDESLHLAMDYDLWWRLYLRHGPPRFVDAFVAVNREHDTTKTATRRREHYREAIYVVRRHYGRVPLKWYLYQPYAVWYRRLVGR